MIQKIKEWWDNLDWCKLGLHEYRQTGVMSRVCQKCGDIDLNV